MKKNVDELQPIVFTARYFPGQKQAAQLKKKKTLIESVL